MRVLEDEEDLPEPKVPVTEVAQEDAAVKGVGRGEVLILDDPGFNQEAVVECRETSGFGPVRHDEVACDGDDGGNRAFDDKDPVMGVVNSWVLHHRHSEEPRSPLTPAIP